MQLGLFALEVAVAHLVHFFSWELPDLMKSIELDMDNVLALTAPRATRLVLDLMAMNVMGRTYRGVRANSGGWHHQRFT